MNENENLNFNENKFAEVKPVQSSSDGSVIEIDKQKLLLKIQKAQALLASKCEELEESKKTIDGLNPYQKGKLEQKLEDLQALILFGRFKVSEREKNGETISEEEKNIQTLKEGITYEADKVHEQRWSEEQYITPQLQKIDKHIEKSRDMIGEIDSHIRK